MLRAALAAVVVTATVAPALAADHEADRARLLDGITALDRPGVPGNLVVFGDDAFVVVSGGKRPEPVVAAARHGEGRVVAMAHSGYLDPTALAAEGSSRGTLLRNALAWVTDGKEGATVGILGRDPRLVIALTEAGYTTRDDLTDEGPFTTDVVIWKNGHGRGAAEGITAYVESGGALISAACPWGWQQIRRRTSASESVRYHLPENRALRAMGLVYADGTVDATKGGRYGIAESRPDAAHAGRALADLVAGKQGATRRTYLVERALRALPGYDDVFLPVVASALAQVDDDDVPRPGAPLGKGDGLARLAVTVRSLDWREAPPDGVPAFPGHESFPGAVPADAPRVTRTIRLDPAVAGWQSTGLYLPAGEMLRVEIVEQDAHDPTVHAGPLPLHYRVRIGCHKDLLWQKERWERWPEITHEIALTNLGAHTASPWGGPIYFEAQENAGPVTVTLTGSVEAPHFVLGDEESEKAWATRRLAPGPWAEIEGRNMVLSVPSSTVRALDDVKRVAEFWDAVLASHCELAATPLPERRERFVPDVQISVGYMHAGYPIMMHLDTVTPPDEGASGDGGIAPMLDVDARTSESSWGYFHELGHNRQRPWWTFRGTTEVTCNLFSLYTHETLCGVTPWNHPWLAAQKKKAKPYLAAGADFEQWRRQPGLALIVYAQIQREFGWEPFIRVFRDYEEGPASERPTNDQAKIDQFVVRLSKAAKHDLRPLWRRWGAPLSAWVLEDPALAELPEWMPDFDDLE